MLSLLAILRHHKATVVLSVFHGRSIIGAKPPLCHSCGEEAGLFIVRNTVCPISVNRLTALLFVPSATPQQHSNLLDDILIFAGNKQIENQNTGKENQQ